MIRKLKRAWWSLQAWAMERHDARSDVKVWNDDKPHRCPACHTITDPDQLCRHRVVICCRCGTKFTRRWVLHRFLPPASVACPDHEPSPERSRP